MLNINVKRTRAWDSDTLKNKIKMLKLILLAILFNEI